MNSSLPLVSPGNLRARLERLATGDAFMVNHRQYYLPGEPELPLAVVAVNREGGIALVISDRVAAVASWLKDNRPAPDNLSQLAGFLESPILDPAAPCRLVPVHIPKPWGREIWYTGIEARGQSRVTDGDYEIPLPWLLALGEEWLLQPGGGPPNLLKILDPLGEPVFGDLYFELHEEKREVYVVTGIDRRAWPDGVGAIRYGFDQEKRQQASDDESFRRQYLAVVREYEKVRRAIDRQLDAIRERSGVALREPVDAQTVKSWLREIPKELQQTEEKAREEMNSFTRLHPLVPGDVVKVARLTPHALQHGVRAVEFQTPVYERKILNFAQKVLTQDHWDTEQAVAGMYLDDDLPRELAIVEETQEYSLEQVVRFDDFRALRLTLQPGAGFCLDEGDHYKLLMAVEGRVHVGPCDLEREEAALVPRAARDCVIVNRGTAPAVCLISMPAESPA